jgi:transcriptional regulator with XRE-family HTH domain
MSTASRIALDLDDYQGIEMEGFADRLREARAARGLTQARLAELLDVSPRVYNRWETSAAVPRLDTLVKIADILDVTLDELVGRKEPDSDTLRIRNPELHSLYRQIDRLSDEDQQALVVLLDSLVKRSQFQRMMAG